MFSTFDLRLLLYVIRLAGWLKHCNLSLSLSGMGQYTEQGKQREWTDAEGHVLHRMQVNEDCTWDPLYEKYEQAEANVEERCISIHK